MEANPLTSQAASPAATASRSAHANALMEKSMIGEAGYMSAVPKHALNGMIDIVKGIEPELGYGSILQVSEIEAKMRESRIRRTKAVCTYCGLP